MSMDWKCVMPPLREDIIDAVKSLNFDNMTPVQVSFGCCIIDSIPYVSVGS